MENVCLIDKTMIPTEVMHKAIADRRIKLKEESHQKIIANSVVKEVQATDTHVEDHSPAVTTMNKEVSPVAFSDFVKDSNSNTEFVMPDVYSQNEYSDLNRRPLRLTDAMDGKIRQQYDRYVSNNQIEKTEEIPIAPAIPTEVSVSAQEVQTAIDAAFVPEEKTEDVKKVAPAMTKAKVEKNKAKEEVAKVAVDKVPTVGHINDSIFKAVPEVQAPAEVAKEEEEKVTETRDVPVVVFDRVENNEITDHKEEVVVEEKDTDDKKFVFTDSDNTTDKENEAVSFDNAIEESTTDSMDMDDSIDLEEIKRLKLEREEAEKQLQESIKNRDASNQALIDAQKARKDTLNSIKAGLKKTIDDLNKKAENNNNIAEQKRMEAKRTEKGTEELLKEVPEEIIPQKRR